MNRLRSPLLAALLMVSCGGEETAVSTLTAEISRGPLVFKASYFGDLRARSSERILAPELKGMRNVTIQSVVADGTLVKKGDVVLRFETASALDDKRAKQSELEIAQAEMRRVSQSLTKERIDLDLEVQRNQLRVERARLDVVEGVEFVSKVQLEQAKLAVQTTQLELQLAKKARANFGKKRAAALEVQRLKVASIADRLAQVESNLEKLVLAAPADGVVYGPITRLNWNRGQKVAPGKVAQANDVLLELPDLSAFDVDIYVRQRDAALLSEGDTAMVYPTIRPDVPLKAKVIKKETFSMTRNERLNTKTPAGNLRELKITFALDGSHEDLRPGGSVRVDVSAQLADDVLRVPLAGLRPGDEDYVVTLVNGESRTVKIGRSSTSHAEVLEGVSAGDLIYLQ